MSKDYGSHGIEEAHRRLETIKEEHKRQMFEGTGDFVTSEDGEIVEGKAEQAIGMAINNRHRLIADVCEEVQELFPEPEPMEVRRYRALVLSMDTVRHSADLEMEYGDPLSVMQNVALEYRETALGAIENRLVLEKPTEEGDAEVIYIYDPVSKVRHTTALGGYREEYDKRMVEDQKKRLAETILYDPLPDNLPRV